MCEFDKPDKTFASDLYLIYKCSPSARVAIYLAFIYYFKYISVNIHIYILGIYIYNIFFNLTDIYPAINNES